MTRHRWIGIGIAIGVEIAAGSAWAGGFLIYEQGASALGQGGAFVARADDPSAIYYNPAGLAAYPRLGVLAGATAIITSTTASNLPPGGTSTDAATRASTPPTLYVAVPLPGNRVSVGLGAFTQYGLGMTWPKDWPGRTRIISADSRSLTVNPTVAVRVLPRLFLGAGVSGTYAMFEMRRAIDLVQTEAQVHMGGNSMAYGVNGGLLFDAIPDRLRIGVSYRSATHMRISAAKADFQNVPPEFSQQLRDQPVESVIRTPHLIAVAGSVRAAPSLWLSLDIVYATWQSFEWFYLHFPESPDLSTYELQDWNNTVSVRGGGEWAISDRVRLRGGFGYDGTPVPARTLSPIIPDAARFLFSAGASYDMGPFRAELGYMAAVFVGSDGGSQRRSLVASFPARYESMGNLIGAALQYRR